MGSTGYYSQIIKTLIYSVPATLIAIVMHEVAHAAVSYLCGDKQVRQDGRLSLNPFKHLDLMGTLCLIFFHVGWAKPVMVNTRNYKHKKLDFCLVGLAGPLMNFLLAFISLIFMYITMASGSSSGIVNYLYNLFYFIAVLNVGLGVFNMIPVPPLDGSNVLLTFLPDSVTAVVSKYKMYFPLILTVLLLTGLLDAPLMWLNSKVINGMWHAVLSIFGYRGALGGTI